MTTTATQRRRVSPDDLPLPLDVAAAPVQETGATSKSDEEIQAKPGAGEPMVPDDTSRGQRVDPSDWPRPLLRWYAKHGGRNTVTLLLGMKAAREGRVVDLWSPEGSLALTYEDGEYRLTEQALTPTPWRQRVETLIDALAM